MTEREPQRYLELLKRRAASLRLVAKELLDCRDSFTGMHLEATREHILYQRGLCSEIHCLDRELKALRRQLAEGAGQEPEKMSAEAFARLFDADSAAQLQQVREDIATAQRQVRRLNRVYAGLLKRSRRSINVLINVMANYAGTYNPSPGWSARSFLW
jgi:hypothetical protein